MSSLLGRGEWRPVWLWPAVLVVGMLLAWLPLPVAVAFVVATAVLPLILIQPLVGLGLALLAGPFGALEKIVLGNTFLDSGQFLLLLTLAAWLGRGVLRRRILLPHTFLTLPLLLFIVVAALSLPGAISQTEGLKEIVKWVEMLLIVWMVVEQGSGGEGEQGRGGVGGAGGQWVVLGMLLLAGVSQALIGIWQFGLRGYGPEHFIVMGRFYRAYGTFEQPNPFGGYMGLNATLAIGALIGLLIFYGQRWHGRRQLTASIKRHRLWYLLTTGCVAGAAAVTTLALFLSWSRGAWLGFAAALAAMAFFWPRRRWLGIILLGLGAGLFWTSLLLGIVPEPISGRLSSFSQDLQFGDVRGVAINDANYAVLERLAHWQAAVDMARDNLWLGVGFGNYEPAYADYALINWPYALGHAHNYYLNILAETGVLGMAAYLIFWTAVIWQTLRVIDQRNWPQRGIALGLLAAWIYLSVHHLVDKLYVNNIYIHLGVMLGLLQLMYKRSLLR